MICFSVFIAVVRAFMAVSRVILSWRIISTAPSAVLGMAVDCPASRDRAATSASMVSDVPGGLPRFVPTVQTVGISESVRVEVVGRPLTQVAVIATDDQRVETIGRLDKCLHVGLVYGLGPRDMPSLVRRRVSYIDDGSIAFFNQLTRLRNINSRIGH